MAVRAPGGLRELVNLQVVSGMAKPYQVRQFIRLVETFYSDEDEGCIADIPNLVSCSAFGKTPQEAIEEALQARDARLAAAQEQGKLVPKPRSHPPLHSSIA